MNIKIFFIIQILSLLCCTVATGDDVYISKQNYYTRSESYLTCSEFPDPTVYSRFNQTEEYRTAQKEMQEILRIVFNEKTVNGFDLSALIVAPGHCFGDDAVAIRADLDRYSIRIISARCLNVQIESKNEWSDIREEIQRILLDLFRIQDGSKLTSIGIDEKAPGDPAREFQGRLSFRTAMDKFMYIAFHQIGNLTKFGIGSYPGLDDSVYHTNVWNENPIIKFPKLRKMLGLKNVVREDIRERNRRIEADRKAQSAPQALLMNIHKTPTPD